MFAFRQSRYSATLIDILLTQIDICLSAKLRSSSSGSSDSKPHTATSCRNSSLLERSRTITVFPRACTGPLIQRRGAGRDALNQQPSELLVAKAGSNAGLATWGLKACYPQLCQDKKVPCRNLPWKSGQLGDKREQSCRCGCR